MNFIKKNIVFVGILGAFVLLLGGNIYLLIKMFQKHESVTQQFEEKKQTLARLRNRKPFPSQENVKTIREGAKEEASLVDELLKPMREKTSVASPMEGYKCKVEIQKAQQKMLYQLEKNGVQCPPRFYFGFERYQESAPKDEHTPLILKQLAAVEELVSLAVQSHILEIRLIRRTEFEDSPRVDKIWNPEAEPLVSMGDEVNYIDVPGYLYTLMPFVLDVDCDTKALRSFLNALARSPYLFLPRVIQIENYKKAPIDEKAGRKIKMDVFKLQMTSDSMKELSSTGDGKSGVTSPATTNETVVVNSIALPYVLGQERIKVLIRIDWAEFRLEKQSENHSTDKKKDK